MSKNVIIMEKWDGNERESKMKTKHLIFTFAAFPAIILIVLLLVNNFRNSTCSPVGTARWGVQRLALAFKGYHVEFGCYPEKRGTNDYLSTSLAELNRQEFIENYNPGFSTNTWKWLDPWRMPYNVEVLGITMPTNEFHRRFGKGFDITVWSSGVNKINEYGGGDDIVDPYSKKLLKPQKQR